MTRSPTRETGWALHRVRDLVDPARPITYGVVQPGERQSVGVPIIRGRDYSHGEVDSSDLYLISPRIAKQYKRSMVKAGDLILSIVGYVGQVARVPVGLTGANLTQTTARLAISPKHSPQFILHAMRSAEFQQEVSRYTKGSAQPGLNLADVERMLLAVPELPEQTRIADILDTVDDQIRTTGRIVAKLRSIRAGLLYDLIVRPNTDGAASLIPLGDLIGRIGSGVSVNADDTPAAPGQIGVLKTSAVADGALVPSENKAVWVSDRVRVREPIAAGTILVSRMNTPELVGRACVSESAHPYLFLPDRLWQLYPVEQLVASPYWLSLMLTGPAYRKHIEAYATGTSGSMKNISQRDFLSLRVLYVAPDLQADIADRVRSVDLQIDAYLKRRQKLAALRRGLMSDLLIDRIPDRTGAAAL